MFHLSPDEWTAVAAVAAHRDRRDRRLRCRSASPSAGCWRATNSGARPCWTASCICRWCCRRWSPAICCSFRSDAEGRSARSWPIISASFSRSAGPARRCPAASWAFPLMVRPIRLALEAIDRRLEDAAATLGAGRFAGVPHRHPAARFAGRDRRRWCCALPARSANSAPPSPSSPISPARRRRSPPRSTPCCRFPAATPRQAGWCWSRSCSRSPHSLPRNVFARRAGMRFQGE